MAQAAEASTTATSSSATSRAAGTPCIGLDPRDPAAFNDANARETGIQPGYDRLPPQFSRGLIRSGGFEFGPCIGELAEIPELFSVVRGINMATLTHEVGRRYFITGRPPPA